MPTPDPATKVRVSLLASAVTVVWVATAMFLKIFCADPKLVFVTVMLLVPETDIPVPAVNAVKKSVELKAFDPRVLDVTMFDPFKNKALVTDASPAVPLRVKFPPSPSVPENVAEPATAFKEMVAPVVAVAPRLID